MESLELHPRFFHVYQDSPRGREALMQSAFFCRMLGAAPVVYVPEAPRFLMYFENRVVQVDLGEEDWGRAGRSAAAARAAEILADVGLDARFLEVRHRTTPALPDIPVDYDYMACPVPLDARLWLYSDLGMRKLPAVAPFPIFIPAVVSRPWKSILCCHGGTKSAAAVFSLAQNLAREMDLPLDLLGLGAREILDASLQKTPKGIRHFLWLEKGKGNPWMEVPADALIVLAAWGGSWIREALLPSFKKDLRRSLPSPMLFVGPQAAGEITSSHG